MTTAKIYPALAFVFVLAVPLGLSAKVMAEEAKYYSSWVLTPKPDGSAALEKAIKGHLGYRKSKGEPRNWRVYTPVVGEHLDHYVIRACCYSLQELDAYDAWVREHKPMQQWQQEYGNVTSKVSHYMGKVDANNSHWPKGVDYNFVRVTTYEVKPGHWQEMDKDKRTMSDAAKAQNWPYHWSWSSAFQGKGTITLAVPYKNYAAMAAPQKAFPAVLAAHLGSEQKAKSLLNDWSGHFNKIYTSMYRYRPDLSL